MKKNSAMEKGIKAGKFIHTHRRWTDHDLSEHLGVSIGYARKLRNILSVHYPVQVIREAKFGARSAETGHLRPIPALYGLMQVEEK